MCWSIFLKVVIWCQISPIFLHNHQIRYKLVDSHKLHRLKFNLVHRLFTKFR
jgi:hypothetical protein